MLKILISSLLLATSTVLLVAQKSNKPEPEAKPEAQPALTLHCVQVDSSNFLDCKDAGGFDSSCASATCPGKTTQRRQMCDSV